MSADYEARLSTIEDQARDPAPGFTIAAHALAAIIVIALLLLMVIA